LINIDLLNGEIYINDELVISKSDIQLKSKKNNTKKNNFMYSAISRKWSPQEYVNKHAIELPFSQVKLGEDYYYNGENNRIIQGKLEKIKYNLILSSIDTYMKGRFLVKNTLPNIVTEAEKIFDKTVDNDYIEVNIEDMIENNTYYINFMTDKTELIMIPGKLVGFRYIMHNDSKTDIHQLYRGNEFGIDSHSKINRDKKHKRNKALNKTIKHKSGNRKVFDYDTVY